MKTLTLKNRYQMNATLLPNEFIDRYMADANGEFVKVYLFLLRHLNDPSSGITVSAIADCLNNTENDILRAFRYWESTGLLRVERDGEGCVAGLELLGTESAQEDSPVPESTPESTPVRDGSALSETLICAGAALNASEELEGAVEKPAETASGFLAERKESKEARDARETKELKSLLFIAEQYLGKTLSHTDIDAITYFYDNLRMSADLIEYLIESCVENGHKSMHYIQKVAFSWAENKVSTVSQAKEQSASYNRNCYAVLNAFGIKNRGPAASELAFIRKWAEDYAFTPDIIVEACRRTISSTHQPSFEYADSILTKWHNNNIRILSDITALDAAYQKDRAARRATAKARPAAKNMNNFERRRYDMDALEEQLLNSN